MFGLLLGMVRLVCTCWFHSMVTLPPRLVSTDFCTCSYQCFLSNCIIIIVLLLLLLLLLLSVGLLWKFEGTTSMKYFQVKYMQAYLICNSEQGGRISRNIVRLLYHWTPKSQIFYFCTTSANKPVDGCTWGRDDTSEIKQCKSVHNMERYGTFTKVTFFT
jgi:hypothetical protein